MVGACRLYEMGMQIRDPEAGLVLMAQGRT